MKLDLSWLYFCFPWLPLVVAEAWLESSQNMTVKSQVWKERDFTIRPFKRKRNQKSTAQSRADNRALLRIFYSIMFIFSLFSRLSKNVCIIIILPRISDFFSRFPGTLVIMSMTFTFKCHNFNCSWARSYFTHSVSRRRFLKSWKNTRKIYYSFFRNLASFMNGLISS